jgi:hypothetical protein
MLSFAMCSAGAQGFSKAKRMRSAELILEALQGHDGTNHQFILTDERLWMVCD